MSLKEYTNQEIQEELSRRESIKNSEWPKQTMLYFNTEDSHDLSEELSDFLDDKCGFYEGTESHTKAMGSLKEINLAVSVHNDAKVEIAIHPDITEVAADPPCNEAT